MGTFHGIVDMTHVDLPDYTGSAKGGKASVDVMKLDGGGVSGIAAFFIWNATYLTKQYVERTALV